MTKAETDVHALIQEHANEGGLIEVNHQDYPELVHSIPSELRMHRSATYRGRNGISFSNKVVVPHKEKAYEGPPLFKSNEDLDIEEELERARKAAEEAEKAKQTETPEIAEAAEQEPEA